MTQGSHYNKNSIWVGLECSSQFWISKNSWGTAAIPAVAPRTTLWVPRAWRSFGSLIVPFKDLTIELTYSSDFLSYLYLQLQVRVPGKNMMLFYVWCFLKNWYFTIVLTEIFFPPFKVPSALERNPYIHKLDQVFCISSLWLL